jgi:NDP-sugar pyrophosphorylase family protein
MKALILAGGFGTRLRPLSCTRPKMLFPIANRPLLDWVLEGLAESGVTKTVLAVNYMADMIKKNFGLSRYGMKLVYASEPKPLGTGGAIKNAEKALNQDDEPFFVLNGDILSSIDYSKLYLMHKNHRSEATIALREVEDPSRFGVAELTGENQIRRFVEKPRKDETSSRLINAGVYVLNHSVFDLMESGKKISIEREVFPKLVHKGSLYGYTFNDLWIDIGKPNDYIDANKLILEEIAKKKAPNGRNVRISSKAKIIPPVAIGSSVVIEEDASIGPYTSIGNNSVVGKGTKIQGSIVFSKALIGNFTSINGAIIGESAVVGDWVKVEDQCIIGDHVLIDDNVTLTQKVQVCPSKEVEASILQPSTIM